MGRYVVWSAAGVAIFATAVLFRAVRGDSITAAIAVILLFSTLGTRTVRRWSRAEQLVLAAETNTQLSSLPESPLPIVVAKPNIFVELAFYGDPTLRARLVYPVDPELDQLYVGIDTNPRLLSALRRYVPLRIPDYNDFIASTQHFLLAADSQDWLIWHLVMSGFRVTPLQRHWPTGIFEVEPLQ